MPFALGNAQDVEKVLTDVGFSSVKVATDQDTARFPGIRVMVEADLRGWLPLVGVPLSEEQIARILDEAEQALAPYVTTDGAVVFRCSAHIATGKRP